jgi:hypothetical protein
MDAGEIERQGVPQRAQEPAPEGIPELRRPLAENLSMAVWDAAFRPPPEPKGPTPENPHLQYLWFIYAHVPMWSPGRATAGRLP